MSEWQPNAGFIQYPKKVFSAWNTYIGLDRHFNSCNMENIC